MRRILKKMLRGGERCHRAEPLERRVLLAADFGPARGISQDGDLTFPATAEAADFDADGDLDVVTTSKNTRIAWYPNLGNGAFDPARTITADVGVTEHTGSLAAGDVNGDGRTDLVAGFYEYPASNPQWLSKVAWYEYDAAADSWREHVVSVGEVIGLWPVKIADMDRDGDADIVSSNYRFEGTVRVMWFENGGEDWTTHVITDDETIAEGSRAIDIGDVDRDGWPDVVVGARFTGTVVVYRNPHDPQNATENWPLTVIDDQMSGMTGVSVADLDQDGTLDVAVTAEGGWVGEPRTRVGWYRNDPAHPGSFSPVIVPGSGGSTNQPWSVQAADLDVDGDPDLLVGSISRALWYENLGGGNFGSSQEIGSESHAWARAADLNGDGWPDVLSAYADDDRVVWFPAEPGIYQAEEAAITGAAVSSAVPGFTGSGFVDFLHGSGDAVEFTVNAREAGRYELGFRYANGSSSARTMGLTVNGAAVPGGAAFAPTGAWRTWDAAAVTVPLKAGTNTVRLFATGQSGPNLDSLALRRVTPPPAVTYQAEAATLSGPVVGSDAAGYTGTGFADYQRSSRDYVEFPVEVPADGSYALDFRYANGGRNDRPLELRVDGQVLTGRLSFGSTGRWSTWKTRSQPVVLTAGRHEVRLTSIGFNGPNLDALTVTKAATPPPVAPTTLQAEAADLSGPVVASNAGGYTGTGFADYQHGSGDFVEFTYDAPAVGDYRLAFRYANGSTSDRPLELRVNGAVARRNLSFCPTGGWSAWRTVTATVALPAGINKLRLTSIGQNGPNLDAVKVTAVGGPQDGLIAFYPFSGNANDVVGGHHGAVNGATLTGGGYEGQAYTFDGNNTYIHLAGLDINPDVRPNLTMGAWVRPTDDSPVRQVISHDDSDFDRSLGIDYRGGGVGWSAFSGTAGVVGYAPVELDAWTFVAVTYDQAASDVRLYVNGDTYREGGSLGPGHSFTDIGRNPSYGEYFAGTIDNVFFFDRVLTEAEINAIRAGGEAAIRGYAS